MTCKERTFPVFPAILIGVLAMPVWFILWTAGVYPSQRMIGGYGVFAKNPSMTPGAVAPVKAVCSLALQQLCSAAPQPAVSAPVKRTASVAAPVVVAKIAPPDGFHSPAVLDKRRLFALGAIETGNNDYEIGRAGEVSRYQIMPSVWKHYSRSSYYDNPQVSQAVAQKHWSSLYASFKKQAGREPDNFDMYVLWNTCYGYYASRSFKPTHLDPVVRDRAQRFVNLVQRGES